MSWVRGKPREHNSIVVHKYDLFFSIEYSLIVNKMYWILITNIFYLSFVSSNESELL